MSEMKYVYSPKSNTFDLYEEDQFIASFELWEVEEKLNKKLDLERQLEEANSMTEHYRNLWLEICISHNELNSKLQEQLKEKFTYTDSKGTYLPNDIKDELRFSMGVSKYKHTHAVCEGALERIEDLERQLAEARELHVEVILRLKNINSHVPSCYAGVSQEIIKVINKLKEKGE